MQLGVLNLMHVHHARDAHRRQSSTLRNRYKSGKLRPKSNACSCIASFSMAGEIENQKHRHHHHHHRQKRMRTSIHIQTHSHRS